MLIPLKGAVEERDRPNLPALRYSTGDRCTFVTPIDSADPVIAISNDQGIAFFHFPANQQDGRQRSAFTNSLQVLTHVGVRFIKQRQICCSEKVLRCLLDSVASPQLFN